MSAIGGVERGEYVQIGGGPQWVTIRGADLHSPAVLVIGGPGGGYAALAPYFADWERDFTLVQWDPPGSGFTFGKTGAEPRGLDHLVSDGLEVVAYVRARLRVPRVALLCFSAGTLVGLTMIQRCPELFSGYVANGQVTNWSRQDSLSYRLLLERGSGDPVLRAELEALGPPPYADAAADATKSKYALAPTSRELPGLEPFTAAVEAALRGQPVGAAYLASGVAWPEPRTRAMAVYTQLRSEIVTFDALRLGTRFAVPMFFIQGVDDVYTVTSEVAEYAARIVAPYVDFATIDGAGHFALLLRDDLLKLLRERVRPRLLR